MKSSKGSGLSVDLEQIRYGAVCEDAYSHRSMKAAAREGESLCAIGEGDLWVGVRGREAVRGEKEIIVMAACVVWTVSMVVWENEEGDAVVRSRGW